MNQFLSQESQFVTEHVGRKKGVPNKIPRAVKEAILLAAEHVGRKNHSNHPFDGLVSLFGGHCFATSGGVHSVTGASIAVGN